MDKWFVIGVIDYVDGKAPSMPEALSNNEMNQWHHGWQMARALRKIIRQAMDDHREPEARAAFETGSEPGKPVSIDFPIGPVL